MRVLELPDGTQVYHDLRGSLLPIVALCLRGRGAIAALGPIYDQDPATEVLRPFRRSAQESGWAREDVGRDLCPEWAWEQARLLRGAGVSRCLDVLFEGGVADLVDWTRAGVVLEMARMRGIRVVGRGLVHVPWRLKGTVTGRFGTEPVRGPDWTFNPLSLGPDDRWRIRPDFGRRLAVLDFQAMDLCSMVSLVPGLAPRYAESRDMHMATVFHLFGQDYSLHDAPALRALAKEQIFVHAYGGQSSLRQEFERVLPELDWLRRMPHGDGARRVQAQSARAFRAALSRVMPLLLGDGVSPLFTVHDELALEYSEECSGELAGVAKAMEEGASQTIGVPYHVGLSTGVSYEEAKHR